MRFSVHANVPFDLLKIANYILRQSTKIAN